MGKSTISMAIFNSYVTNYQRVSNQMFLSTTLFIKKNSPSVSKESIKEKWKFRLPNDPSKIKLIDDPLVN
jgi:hypothetical protein